MLRVLLQFASAFAYVRAHVYPNELNECKPERPANGCACTYADDPNERLRDAAARADLREGCNEPSSG